MADWEIFSLERKIVFRYLENNTTTTFKSRREKHRPNIERKESWSLFDFRLRKTLNKSIRNEKRKFKLGDRKEIYSKSDSWLLEIDSEACSQRGRWFASSLFSCSYSNSYHNRRDWKSCKVEDSRAKNLIDSL